MRIKNLRYLAFRILFFTIIFFCVGCEKKEQPGELQGKFDSYMNELFKEDVQSDTLSLNYSLANPEKYGIKYNETTYGEYTVTHMKEDLTVSENHLDRLLQFDCNKLRKDQQLTYKIVERYLKQQMKLGNYLYYNECLGPTTGIQAQLPILLAEYGFYTKSDVNRYIELLNCTDNYFNEMIQFEKEKSSKGLFMSDAVADRIIEQCKEFVKSPENNFLITYFNNKINSYNGLTKEEITAYQTANRTAVLKHVIPAYENLIDTLLELKGTGTNSAGLYYYPEGKDYYECLAQYKTGSDKSIKEMSEMLEKAISSGILKITTLTLIDKDLMNKYNSFTRFPITDPEKILTDLKDDITKDFPTEEPVNCKVKYVPDSLSKFLSPAMYLIPPIDNYKNNNIYINGSDEKTLSMIYTTVAHESYPGHLYQCVFFRNQNPAPIRNVMNFLGYDEGWATYVELYSYHMAGIDENLASFLEANNSVILCMYARVDIGIHYEGWKKEDAVNYISNFLSNKAIAESIYNTLLEEPAVYLPYAIGYLEIMELKDEAKNELGNSFKTKDFHEFLLETGPAQFSVIEDYMQKWVTSKISNNVQKNVTN